MEDRGRVLRVGVAYPALLLIGSHGWLLAIPAEQDIVAHASYAAQQLWVVLLYALLDAIVPSRWFRFLLAGTAALHLASIHLDALLIHVVGLSSYRAVLTFYSGGMGTLSEIGLRPSRLVLIVCGILAACAAGGVLQRMLDRLRVSMSPKRAAILFVPSLALIPLLFFAEQRHARDTDRYVYRSVEMPGYLQIFETSTRSHRAALDSPIDTLERHEQLMFVGRARNPRHVVFFLLESLRADAIDPEISPTLHQLAETSLDFENAHSEAIFTPLAWNVLLLDRPAHMFVWPRRMLAPREPGSWPLAVLKRAGYEIWIASATDLDYGDFLSFMLGAPPIVDRLYVDRDEERERWQRDDRATQILTEWIETSPLDRPTFMLLQLDSTHWTYQFPPDAAIVEPFSEPIDMPVPLTTEEEFRLLHNRYLNCVHHVDRKIARVLESLRKRGIEKETVLIAVSDHGEGFEIGVQGHSMLCDATTRIPLMLRLPGVKPRQINEPTSFRNIFPTLFDYLQIESFDEELMLGRSMLRKTSGDHEILILSPDGRRADLRLADGSRIQFNVLIRERDASFTPIGMVGPKGDPIEEPFERIEQLPWRTLLEQRLNWRGRRAYGGHLGHHSSGS